VAQTVGNLRLLEDDRDEARSTSEEWGRKAAAASARADGLRGENPAEAERFDGLARIALRKQIGYEQQVDTFDGQIVQQEEMTTKLKDGLVKLRDKRDDLVRRRDELVSRAKMAQAQTQVQEAVRSVSVLDPSSELGRFEERIRRQEAQATGMAEVAASSMESQFAELDELSDDVEVEQRLKRLKGGA
jgi:phage shock protein A